MTELVDGVIRLVETAGRRVMEVYGGSFESTLKADNSPLTEADLASHKILCEGLAALDPSIPILSEEAAEIPYEQRRDWSRFWLVDPLDGTKEFIGRTGEFTVNVALVENGRPTLGVVGAPALETVYVGYAPESTTEADADPGRVSSVFRPSKGGGPGRGIAQPDSQSKKSAKAKSLCGSEAPPASSPSSSTTVSPGRMLLPAGAFRNGRRVYAATYSGGPLKVVASRSHAGAETESWLRRLEEQYPEIELVSCGSSLKLCMIADGHAHLYPRLGPTMEWDIAAAYAVVVGAGGFVTDFEGRPLEFNKPDLHNPWFLVSARGVDGVPF